MRVAGDVCRKKELEVDLEKASQLARLMTCMFAASDAKYFLANSGIVIQQTPDSSLEPIMNIKIEPLNPIGLLNPKSWFEKFFSGLSSASADVIRAVFQDQRNWLYTKLPDMEVLQKLLDAMQPGVWKINLTPGVPPAIRFQLEVKGNNPSFTVFTFHRDEVLGSDILERSIIEQQSFAGKPDAGLHYLAGLSTKELNRFLPWLIRLAGGKIKILPEKSEPAKS